MMKLKSILLLVLGCALPASAAERSVSYLEEVYSLGSVAGQGLACQSNKYDEYELLARAIMIGKAQIRHGRRPLV